MTMKKEGIQTRNRKLSSKSKKKKAGGCLGLGGVMGDMIKASGHLDLDNKPFHSGFGSPMGKSRLFDFLRNKLPRFAFFFFDSKNILKDIHFAKQLSFRVLQ